jgi:hypothetical protein
MDMLSPGGADAVGARAAAEAAGAALVMPRFAAARIHSISDV